jgi:hypothetical protein
MCKIVLLDFVHSLNFGSWILLLSSGKKGRGQKPYMLSLPVELYSELDAFYNSMI